MCFSKLSKSAAPQREGILAMVLESMFLDVDCCQLDFFDHLRRILERTSGGSHVLFVSEVVMADSLEHVVQRDSDWFLEPYQLQQDLPQAGAVKWDSGWNDHLCRESILRVFRVLRDLGYFSDVYILELRWKLCWRCLKDPGPGTNNLFKILPYGPPKMSHLDPNLSKPNPSPHLKNGLCHKNYGSNFGYLKHSKNGSLWALLFDRAPRAINSHNIHFEW